MIRPRTGASTSLRRRLVEAPVRGRIIDQCEVFGQGQGSAFLGVKVRGFLPGGQDAEAFGVLPFCQRIMAMDSQAVGASIDLGYADLDELDEERREALPCCR